MIGKKLVSSAYSHIIPMLLDLCWGGGGALQTPHGENGYLRSCRLL